MTTQTCNRCNTTYPLDTDHYHRCKSYSNGFNPRCKVCSKETSRHQYLKRASKDHGLVVESYCKSCLQTLSADTFYKDINSPNGCMPICKDCHKQQRNTPEGKVASQQKKLRLRAKLRQEAFTTMGGECVCCGENNFNNLSTNHINNDGAEHRRADKSSIDILQWLRNNDYPQGVVEVMCFNCNLAHGYFGYCPHKGRPDLPVSNATLIRSEQKRIAGIRARRKLKRTVLAHYSQEAPSCVTCGESHLEFLALDHVDGKGKQHKLATGKLSADAFYRWIRDNDCPPLFQVLCHNCNCSKEFVKSGVRNFVSMRPY